MTPTVTAAVTAPTATTTPIETATACVRELTTRGLYSRVKPAPISTMYAQRHNDFLALRAWGSDASSQHTVAVGLRVLRSGRAHASLPGGVRVGRTCVGILVILRRFLRPWWVVSNVLVLALLVVMVNLGAWQLRRL